MQVGSLEVIDETRARGIISRDKEINIIKQTEEIEKKKTPLKLCDNSNKSNRYVILSLFYEIYKKNCYVGTECTSNKTFLGFQLLLYYIKPGFSLRFWKGQGMLLACIKLLLLHTLFFL